MRRMARRIRESLGWDWTVAGESIERDRQVVRERYSMDAYRARLSAVLDRIEATPEDGIEWLEGDALVDGFLDPTGFSTCLGLSVKAPSGMDRPCGEVFARSRPKRSSDPDGEVSRRDRRGRRGVLGGEGLTLEPYSTTALVYCESVSLKITPKSRLQSMNLPTPIGWSKTSPRPLREAFRVRMGRTRAEAQRRRGEGREFRDTSEPFSTTALVCGQRITPIPPLKKV